MKIRGYHVEYLPLERRLLERRFLDSALSIFENERRMGERRDLPHTENSGQLNFDLNTPHLLIH